MIHDSLGAVIIDSAALVQALVRKQGLSAVGEWEARLRATVKVVKR